ncbi:MAG TPA: hypothetical protein VM165_08740 [Planctomycetaceae bacterium]|nr:hypothetical protein [Planctomycetaceae bacterium]
MAGSLIALALAGCAVIPVLPFPGFGPVAASEKDTATNRYEFQTNRDAQALNWLLTNCIQNGQTVSEVSRLLGETGEREFADRELKTSGDGHYLDSDVAFRWGPDANGRTIILFFRDGKLVNFDPDELRR